MSASRPASCRTTEATSGQPLDPFFDRPLEPAFDPTFGQPGRTDGVVPEHEWQVVEESFDRARLRARETVFTIGNGLLGTRGSFEEGYPGDRPATLIHGVFDSHPVAVTELVNAPDWSALEVIVAGERFSMDRGDILSYRRHLDLRTGVLVRDVRWRSPGGRTCEIHFERFASLADPHLLCQRVTITPLDFDGRIEVRAGLDGRQETDQRTHWTWLGQTAELDRASLYLQTRDTGVRLGMAIRLTGIGGRKEDRGGWDVKAHPTLVRSWHGETLQPAGIEKLVVLYTSLEVEDPIAAARTRIDAASREMWEDFLATNASAWRGEWALSDVVIEGDAEAQLAVRFSIFQLLTVAPRESDRVSIGAKTLSGFGYRGHVFWDTEIFMLPFFTFVRPRVARNLLSYRWHQLAAARRKAESGGFTGAQYAWETADTGDEVTPTWLPDGLDRSRLVRIWTGDIEIHVSADIAFAVWQYWRASGDDRFMIERGAEVIFETARFWASRAQWSSASGKYEFRDVIGPDEYHDHVDNNAYTNYLIQWHLRTACEIGRWLGQRDPRTAARLLGEGDAQEATLQGWARIAEGILLPIDSETLLIPQFDGYFARRDVDLAAYEGRSASMQAILGIEGVNETQVIKQPDVLMLAALLPDLFDEKTVRANYNYYTPRTDHTYGSSLGPAIQAILSCRVGKPLDAYEHLMRAARADLYDVRGNAGEGIHGASAGGIWQSIVLGFAGLRVHGDRWTARPALPPHWTRLAFKFFLRGRLQTVDLRQEATEAFAVSGEAGALAPRAAAPALPVRGFIFDLDGVLTDTAEYHYLAWQQLADQEGIPFDRAANEALRGVSRRESLERLLGGRRISEAEARAWMERKNRYYVELIDRMSPADVLPGVTELLAEARAARISIAVASASKNARQVIDKIGLGSAIDVICDGYTVKRTKPAPDLFFAAADRLVLDPAACVVFEDAGAGIEAAHAGGMRAVGIGPAERVGEAELVLPDGLAAVHLADILVALGHQPGGPELG